MKRRAKLIETLPIDKKYRTRVLNILRGAGIETVAAAKALDRGSFRRLPNAGDKSWHALLGALGTTPPPDSCICRCGHMHTRAAGYVPPRPRPRPTPVTPEERLRLLRVDVAAAKQQLENATYRRDPHGRDLWRIVLGERKAHLRAEQKAARNA